VAHLSRFIPKRRPLQAKNCLILLKFQEPGRDFEGSPLKAKTQSLAKKAIFLRAYLARFALILTFLAPIVAQASIFSLVAKAFDKSAAEEKPVNSQKIALLQSVSSIDPKLARGGGDVNIVDGTALLAENGPAGTVAEIEEAPVSGEISLYVVKKGDSISAVAKMFGVSTNTILWANDLPKGAALKEGDTLTILPISGVIHTVKSGDTLAGIARKYGGDVDEILQFNSLANASDIKVGMEITVPDGVINNSTPSKSVTKIASNLPSVSGYFTRPLVSGRKTQGIHGYNGIDLGAPVGTDILASAGGQVLVSKSGGWNGGYGGYVVIKHPNGTQTLYAHTSANYVNVGDTVAQGQVIAAVGNTGKSTGPHLHFEVRGAKNPF
jgi:LysM repeat protein